MRSTLGDESGSPSLENGETEARGGRDLLKVLHPVGGRRELGLSLLIPSGVYFYLFYLYSK